MGNKSNFDKDDIIKALLDAGIFCEEPTDGETHFYDENGKEIDENQKVGEIGLQNKSIIYVLCEKK